jgi:hypothetical protein
MCVALTALFVSLGGTSYAVTTLPRSSVGNAQLRDRAVTERKLADSAVITSKIANGAVTNRKIARNSITAGRIAANALGGDQIDESKLAAVPRATDAFHADLASRASGADHATNSDHAALADHATASDRADRADRAGVATSLAAVDYNTASVTLAEGGLQFAQADCDAGDVAVGGGYLQSDDFADLTEMLQSAPAVPAGTAGTGGWAVIIRDGAPDTGQPAAGVAFVACVDANATF